MSNSGNKIPLARKAKHHVITHIILQLQFLRRPNRAKLCLPPRESFELLMEFPTNLLAQRAGVDAIRRKLCTLLQSGARWNDSQIGLVKALR